MKNLFVLSVHLMHVKDAGICSFVVNVPHVQYLNV